MLLLLGRSFLGALTLTLVVACSAPSQPVDAGVEPVDGRAEDAGAIDAGASNPPRILLIIADDLGVDATAIYADEDGDGTPDDGRAYAPMPTVTDLCQRGMRFTQAYAAPTCSPTRASILTGRYGFRTGVGWALDSTDGIDPAERTLPQALTAYLAALPPNS